MRLSLANIELVKKIIQFSTVFSTIFDQQNKSQIRPEQGDSQAGDKVGDSKTAFFQCAKNSAQGSTQQKQAFLVRKKVYAVVYAAKA